MPVALVTAEAVGADLTNLNAFFGGIDSFSNGTPTSFSAANSGDDRKFNFTGSGLTYDGVTGRPLTGTIDGIEILTGSDVLLVTFDFDTPFSADAFFDGAELFETTGFDATQLNAIFNTFNFTFNGNTGDDKFNSYGLADTLLGGDGNDEFRGGAGADTINGGAGSDWADYLISSAGVTVTLGKNGAETIGAGGDALGDKISLVENIRGSNLAADILTGNNLVNIIQGKAYDDVIDGGIGADVLDGGSSNEVAGDTVTYAASLAAVTVTLGTPGAETFGAGGDAQGDSLKNFENITGSAKNDVLTGNGSANKLEGGAGDDIIEGGADADILDGGAGINTLSYANSPNADGTPASAVSVNLQEGSAAALVSGDDAAGDVATNFQNLIGSKFRDIFFGNSAANTISGGEGNDTLAGEGGIDILNGGIGDDVLVGGTAADTLIGGNDIDRVFYGDGAIGVTVALGKDGAQTTGAGAGSEALGDKISQVENITGSAGNDKLTGNNLVNDILGLAGNDVIEGGALGDTLIGGDDIDTLSYAGSTAGVTITINGAVQTAGSGGDAAGDLVSFFENITGSKHADKLTGDGGGNVIDGGLGDDIIFGGAGFDTLKGGTGLDTLSYFKAADAVNVTLDGTNAASVSGGDAAGDDATGFENLIGTVGNDTLTGDGGANVIEGGDGDDLLAGGTGNDTISYAGASAGIFFDLSKVGVEQDTVGGGKDTWTGFENVIGSDNDDLILGDIKANIINGGGGTDKISGGAGADTLDGGAGTADFVAYHEDDKGVIVTLGVNGAKTTASGPAGSHAAGDNISNFENIIGGKGNDKLTGNALKNDINGAGGDDFIIGGFGDDKLDGENNGLGGDTVSYSTALTGVNVNLSLGTASGGGDGDELSNFENVIGSAKNDVLFGDDFNNMLDGGLGNDVVEGHGGDDVLKGNTGIDTASYASANAAVTVSLATLVQQDTGGAGKDTLSGFENLTGSAFADVLTGDAKDNVILGLDENDKIFGGAGNDTIEGGLGNDILDGQAGVNTVSYANVIAGVLNVDLAFVGVSQNTIGGGQDTLSNFQNIIGSNFGAGLDTLKGDGGKNVISGLDGFDIITGGAGADILDGGAGTFDRVEYLDSASSVTVSLGKGGALTVGKGGDAAGDKIINFESIVGSDHNDVLTGNSVFNVLNGDDGNDLIEGGAGADQLIGGGDLRDTVSYSKSAAGVTVALDDNGATIGSAGDAAGDNISGFFDIIGSAKDDKLTGSDGDNIIDGLAGNDIINGGKGDDTLKGNTGIDVVSYAGSATAVTVNLATLIQQDTVGAGKDTLSGFENILGSGQADTLTGDSKVNVIEGGAGADKLTGGGGADTVSYAGSTDTDMDTFGVTVSLSDLIDTAGTVFGDDGANDVIKNFVNITGSALGDVLTGNKFANILSGGKGNDTLIGKSGADTLLGSDGADIASYQGSALGVTVTLGKDGAQSTGKGGDAAGDKLMQIEGLTGSDANDVLTGNNQFNSLNGGQGDDVIEGGAGADTLDGGSSNETIGDTLSYAASSDAVTINLQANTAFGGDADGDGNSNFENVTGSNFDDELAGSSTSDNILKGGGGNDRLRGFLGADTLDGGAGTADHADYADDNTGMTIVLGANGAQTLGIGGLAAGDKILNIENVTGGLQGDVLTGNALKNVISGNDGSDVINGGGGDDTLDGGSETAIGDTLTYAGTAAAVTVRLNIVTEQNTGGAGKDTISGFENLTGGNGADFLTGDNNVNVIQGGTGNDTIEGRQSGDTLDGGANIAGGDTVSYANAEIFGVTVDLNLQGTTIGAADATVQSSDGDANNDLLYGFENLTGSAQGDILTGDEFANIISGGGGDDLIRGGLGADTLDGGTHGVGGDSVSYDSSAANVTVTLGNNGAQSTVTGAGGSAGIGDKIKNFENVEGSGFNDKLTGNALDNDLTGLMGPDNLTGGLGSDSFVYNAAAEGSDTITDFVSGTDDIAIDAAGFGGNLAAGPLAANYFVSGAGAVATENGHGQFLFDTATNQLFWDDDGTDGNAKVLIVNFTSTATLTASDFDLF